MAKNVGRMTPKPHQKQAVSDLVRHFKLHRRGKFISACGTGKTATSFWVVDQIGAQRVLYCAPSIALLDQAFEEWSGLGDFSALVVCSDQSVGERDTPVWTDPEMIDAELRRLDSQGGRVVVFSTYCSAWLLRNAGAFDFLVADESHHIAGPPDKLSQVVMDDEEIECARRMFQTATQKLVSGEASWSMDDPERFGEVAHEFSLPEAIDQGIVTDYEIRVVGLKAGSEALLEKPGAHLAARAGALAKGLEEGVYKHAITFHRTKAGARRFAGHLHDLGVDAEPIFGDTPVQSRRDLIEQGLDKPAAAWPTAKALSEGIDIPAVDAVMLVDPRSSPIDLVQILGRALRINSKRPDKVATVVLALVVPDGMEPEDLVRHSEWSKLWQVMQVMKSMDPRLAATISSLVSKVKNKNQDRALPCIIFEGDGFRDLEALEEIASAVYLRSAELDSHWFSDGLKAFVKFAERESSGLVPVGHVESGIRLYDWARYCRNTHKRGALPLDFVRRLESLPLWVWDPAGQRWGRWFKILKRYLDAYGSAAVPHGTIFEGAALGQWVVRQRMLMRKGRLPKEFMGRLEGLPGWHWGRSLTKEKTRMSALRAFIDREGHSRVPYRHTEVLPNGKEVPLGQWVNGLKADKLKVKKTLLGELEEMPGWEWNRLGDVPYNRCHIKMLRLLSDFCKKNKHSIVPMSLMVDGEKIGQWVRDRRRSRGKSAALDRDLEKIDFWSWESNPKQKERRKIAALKRFWAREGHIDCTQRHREDGVAIGQWVTYMTKKSARSRKELRDLVASWEAEKSDRRPK